MKYIISDLPAPEIVKCGFTNELNKYPLIEWKDLSTDCYFREYCIDWQSDIIWGTDLPYDKRSGHECVPRTENSFNITMYPSYFLPGSQVNMTVYSNNGGKFGDFKKCTVVTAEEG